MVLVMVLVEVQVPAVAEESAAAARRGSARAMTDENCIVAGPRPGRVQDVLGIECKSYAVVACGEDGGVVVLSKLHTMLR